MMSGRKFHRFLNALPGRRPLTVAALLLAAVVVLVMPGRQLLKAADSSGFLSANWWRLLIQSSGNEGEEGRSELEQRELYWANRRGLQFGVPRDGYQNAAAAMVRMAGAASIAARPELSV